ncbi:hypothetical protein J6590_047155 [Homalodisca vitripennis]|nr:hypothetical protein J6590_047155 [Homalodisca vitripennis]
MPAPHPQTPKLDPPRPTVHGTNVSVPSQTADLPQWKRSRRFRPSTTDTTSGAHGGIVQSRTEVDLILTDFDKDKREAIVSLPRKMLVKYTAGNDCQHQKSSTIFNNKKYTEENSV